MAAQPQAATMPRTMLPGYGGRICNLCGFRGHPRLPCTVLVRGVAFPFPASGHGPLRRRDRQYYGLLMFGIDISLLSIMCKVFAGPLPNIGQVHGYDIGVGVTSRYTVHLIYATCGPGAGRFSGAFQIASPTSAANGRAESGGRLMKFPGRRRRCARRSGGIP